jgi:Flp pilus assembly protein TadB
MDFLVHLWLPIVASAVAVFVGSALGWMLVGHHKGDMNKLTEEQDRKLIEALKTLNLAPGVYGYPDMHKKMTREEQKKCYETMFQNPVGMLRVWKHPHMGVNMFKTFLVNVVVSVFIAYIGWTAFGAAPKSFMQHWQLLGTCGVLAYSFSFIPCEIWYQQTRRALTTMFIDGVVLGLLCGAVMSWLWPVA